mmetsp:Transcript_15067/g.43227  ORF Transcript_15067/g.43227 Transcript_15067/m.43227 type:complete len:100 (+) Transcript_15067:168-467(+)
MMETNQSGVMKTLLVVTAAFGGAFAGTLATHALAPAPALEESFVAAEKMEPAFKMTTEKMAVPAQELALPAEKLVVPEEPDEKKCGIGESPCPKANVRR